MKAAISKGGPNTERMWLYKVLGVEGDVATITEEFSNGVSMPQEVPVSELVEISEEEYKLLEEMYLKTWDGEYIDEYTIKINEIFTTNLR